MSHLRANNLSPDESTDNFHVETDSKNGRDKDNINMLVTDSISELIAFRSEIEDSNQMTMNPGPEPNQIDAHLWNCVDEAQQVCMDRISALPLVVNDDSVRVDRAIKNGDEFCLDSAERNENVQSENYPNVVDLANSNPKSDNEAEPLEECAPQDSSQSIYKEIPNPNCQNFPEDTFPTRPPQETSTLNSQTAGEQSSSSLNTPASKSASEVSTVSLPGGQNRLISKPCGKKNEKVAEDDSDLSWYSHKRHVLVFTISGKPVFSRYGVEEKLCALTGCISAMNAKFAHILSSAATATSDELQHFVVGDFTFALLHKGSLIYLCISSCADESMHIKRLLLRLHSQIMSILTNRIETTLIARPNYNIRPLLSGMEATLENVITWYNKGLVSVIEGFEVLPLRPSMRSIATNIVRDISSSISIAARIDNINRPNMKDTILGAILIADRKVVCLAVSHLMPVFHHEDIMCLMDLIWSCPSLQQTESWAPVCLPTFNESVFVYAYINFFSPRIGLVILSAISESVQFHSLAVHYKRCRAMLTNSGCLTAISKSLEEFNSPLPAEVIFENPDLSADALIQVTFCVPASYGKFGVANRRPGIVPMSSLPAQSTIASVNSLQYFGSAFCSSDTGANRRIKRILKQYRTCRDLIAGAALPAKISLEEKNEIVFVYHYSDFHIYCAFASWLDVSSQWLEILVNHLRNLSSHLFILEIPPIN